MLTTAVQRWGGDDDGGGCGGDRLPVVRPVHCNHHRCRCRTRREHHHLTVGRSARFYVSLASGMSVTGDQRSEPGPISLAPCAFFAGSRFVAVRCQIWERMRNCLQSQVLLPLLSSRRRRRSLSRSRLSEPVWHQLCNPATIGKAINASIT